MALHTRIRLTCCTGPFQRVQAWNTDTWSSWSLHIFKAERKYLLGRADGVNSKYNDRTLLVELPTHHLACFLPYTDAKNIQVINEALQQ